VNVGEGLTRHTSELYKKQLDKRRQSGALIPPLAETHPGKGWPPFTVAPAHPTKYRKGSIQLERHQRLGSTVAFRDLSVGRNCHRDVVSSGSCEVQDRIRARPYF
jgi:hypothetical protein